MARTEPSTNQIAFNFFLPPSQKGTPDSPIMHGLRPYGCASTEKPPSLPCPLSNETLPAPLSAQENTLGRALSCFDLGVRLLLRNFSRTLTPRESPAPEVNPLVMPPCNLDLPAHATDRRGNPKESNQGLPLLKGFPEGNTQHEQGEALPLLITLSPGIIEIQGKIVLFMNEAKPCSILINARNPS